MQIACRLQNIGVSLSLVRSNEERIHPHSFNTVSIQVVPKIEQSGEKKFDCTCYDENSWFSEERCSMVYGGQVNKSTENNQYNTYKKYNTGQKYICLNSCNKSNGYYLTHINIYMNINPQRTRKVNEYIMEIDVPNFHYSMQTFLKNCQSTCNNWLS